MDTREINKYKIKNTEKIQKINGTADKIKVLPKRYMPEIGAKFINADIIDTAEVAEVAGIIEPVTKTKKEKIKKPKKIKEKKVKKSKGQPVQENEDKEENIFFDSLNDMTPKDIVLNEVAKNVKKPSVDFVRYFALLLSLAIFVFAGYNIVNMLYSYVAAAKHHDELRELFYATVDEDSEDAIFLRQARANIPIKDILSLQKQTGARFIESDTSDKVNDAVQHQYSMKKLTDLNPDTYCWIKVSFTTIDYPVVQSYDNDFYLYHNFNKGWSKSGAIFADYRNSRDIASNRNLIIYGHNMVDNSMFQPLIDYSKHESYFRNGIIELITKDAMYYYEVFSICEEDPFSGYIRTEFTDDEQGNEEFVQFLRSMEERSIFHKDVILDADTKMITLSTCINDWWINRRFVVRGILIDVK